MSLVRVQADAPIDSQTSLWFNRQAMLTEKELKAIKLSPKEQGISADLRMERILRPDQRVVLERIGVLRYESQDNHGNFNRRLTLIKVEKGQKREVVLVSDRIEDQVVGGVVYFNSSNGEALPKSSSGTQETLDMIDSFLKEMTGR